MNPHSDLAPSAAHRWLHCPASARLEATFPDYETEFAIEGTRAHECCASMLRDELCKPVEAEMLEACKTYANYVKSLWDTRQAPDAKKYVERRLSLAPWVPQGFGTADCVIIDDGVCWVIDFKYGKGVEVSAANNPQLMLYALGCLEEFDALYDLREFKLAIVQPRMGNLSEWGVSREDLARWAATEVVPSVMAAVTDGEPRCGTWCQFCKALTACPAVMQAVEQRPATLDPEEADAKLLQVPIIKKWCEEYVTMATDAAVSGTRFDHFYLAPARTLSKVADPWGLRSYLAGLGLPKEAYLRTEELKTITELRKLNIDISKYLIKPEGKPTLKCKK